MSLHGSQFVTLFPWGVGVKTALLFQRSDGWSSHAKSHVVVLGTWGWGEGGAAEIWERVRLEEDKLKDSKRLKGEDAGNISLNLVCLTR